MSEVTVEKNLDEVLCPVLLDSENQLESACWELLGRRTSDLKGTSEL